MRASGSGTLRSGRLLRRLARSRTVSGVANRLITIPFSFNRSPIPGLVMRPPPQDTMQPSVG